MHAVRVRQPVPAAVAIWVIVSLLAGCATPPGSTTPAATADAATAAPLPEAPSPCDRALAHPAATDSSAPVTPAGVGLAVTPAAARMIYVSPNSGGQIALERVAGPPPNRYLYVEAYTEIYASAPALPTSDGSTHTAPRWHFDPATGILEAIDAGMADYKPPGHWGYWGDRWRYSGSGIERTWATVSPDAEMPLMGGAWILTGVAADGSYEYWPAHLSLLTVGSSGAIEFRIDNRHVVLAPYQSWERCDDVDVVTSASHALYQEMLRITNYGWQDRARIVQRHGQVAITTDGGTTWTARRIEIGTAGVWDISCPTTQVCYMATSDGGEFLATSDGGATWQRLSAPAEGARRITCPDTGHCIMMEDVVGASPAHVFVTTNGGVSWGTHALEDDRELLAISCPEATACVSVGTDGLIAGTKDGGHTWQVLSSGVTATLFDVTCPNTQVCYAVGGDFEENHRAGVIVVTTDAGNTWQAHASSVPPLQAISCMSSDTCLALSDGEMLRLANWGATWTSLNAPEVSIFFDLRLACPAPDLCFLARPWLDRTIDGGNTWLPFTLNTDYLDYVQSISCPDASTCFATLVP